MAIASEPLKRRHGVLLYSAQPTKDTPVTPATAVGIATARATSQSGMNNVFGMGSKSILFMKPGLCTVPLSITIDHLQDKTFLLRCLRSSGELPYNTIGLGYVDDAGTKYAWQIDNWKTEQVEIACDAGGPVTATFTGTGHLITELTTLVAAQLTAEPFKWYEMLVTKGGVDHEVENLRVSINHNVTQTPVIRGTAATTRKRMPKYSSSGYEDITGQFSRFAKSGISLQADTIALFDLLIALADAPTGTNTCSIALTNCKFLEEEFSIQDDIRFGMPWRASTFNIT